MSDVSDVSGWVVTAPAVVVRVGQHVHIVGRGRAVPDGASADDVARLSRKGMIAALAGDVVPAVVPPPAVPEFSKMNLGQLRSYAHTNGVNLGGATRKDDVIAVLTTA